LERKPSRRAGMSTSAAELLVENVSKNFANHALSFGWWCAVVRDANFRPTSAHCTHKPYVWQSLAFSLL